MNSAISDIDENHDDDRDDDEEEEGLVRRGCIVLSQHCAHSQKE